MFFIDFPHIHFPGLNLDCPKEFNHLENAPTYDSKELDYYAGLDHISKEDVNAIIARIVDDSRFSEFKVQNLNFCDKKDNPTNINFRNLIFQIQKL